MLIRLFIAILVVFGGLGANGGVADVWAQDRPDNPEIATGTRQVQTATGSKFMAVTAHPDATQAAYDVLSKGGTAADAAIAAQMVLGLVEPQSSGIGGGAFIVYFDAAQGQLFSIDGRETAPDLAGTGLFTRDDGKAIGFYEAANGGRAVGTPSLLRALEKLYEWQGKAPWSDLFQPAIELAENGFTVSHRLQQSLQKEASRFEADTEAKIYFFPDTFHPIEGGAKKVNPDYAATLNYIATNGAASFYEGALARNVVEKVQKNKRPGLLSIEDIAEYQAQERMPVCGGYRGYKICSMGQPSSGALSLLNILGILEHFDLRAMGKESLQSWHIIAEASRLAFADRDYYMADPDFVKTPDTLLLDPDYLKLRASLIHHSEPMLNVSHGAPAGWEAEMPQAKDASIKPLGTTHMSIVDVYGNILSMTSSIENAFGSRIMVDGYLLNNQLTDFAFEPNDANNNPKANRVEGGKRPRSSMSPTIVFDLAGKPFMVIGSAGGSRIIGYVLQRIISVIDWDMDLVDAMKAPNIVHRGRKLELESSGVEMAEGLKNFGHPVLVGEMNSGLTAIQWVNGQMVGVADPRRDGTAKGE